MNETQVKHFIVMERQKGTTIEAVYRQITEK